MHDLIIPVVLKTSGESVLAIKDKLAGKIPKSITVRMEATHSAIVNGNNWFYPPSSLKKGAKTFISPNKAPVTYEHEADSPKLGYVMDSKYVSYNKQVPDIIISDSIKISDKISNIRDFAKSNPPSPSYKGLGHIELVAKITDKDAITKILDGEYSGVSVGGKTSAAYCSVCGNDKKIKDCEHKPGTIHDGQRAFLISEDMEFDHITYTAIPADKNARSTLIKDSEDVGAFLEILDFEITEEHSMKLKFGEISKSNDPLVQHAEELGIKDFKISDSEELQASDYLFADSKSFPMTSELELAVIMDLLQNKVDDSEDKKLAMTEVEDVLKGKTEKSYTEVIADAIAASKKAEEESKQTEAEVKGFELKDSDVNKIVTALADALQIQDGFAGQRLKVLRQEVKTLREQNAQLLGEVKDSLVERICSLGNITDSGKIEKLKQRTISSLQDKLQDFLELNENKEQAHEDKKDISDSKEEADKKDLKENSVNLDTISDSVEDPEAKDKKEDDKKIEDSKKEDLGIIEDSEIKRIYRKKTKEEGLPAAKQWFNGIKEEGRVSESFSFK